jgi:hypothetical protein
VLYEDVVVTTRILLQGAIAFAVLDIVFICILTLRITPGFFTQIKWLLVIFSGLVWFGIWKWLLSVFWDLVYVFVFPIWGKPWLPYLFGVLMAGVSLGIWSIAIKTRYHPVPTFLILTGFWGILTHIWAIYRGVLTKPPMLRGSSPFAALLMAFFEYIFYWCIITSLTVLTYWIYLRTRKI